VTRLPTDKNERKERPITRGVLDYFPDAIAEVAHVSYIGNQQHNPGEEMHWAREKSSDHADCIARHLVERGVIDDDGLRHSAKCAWRALALLQEEIEGDTTLKYPHPKLRRDQQRPELFVASDDPYEHEAKMEQEKGQKEVRQHIMDSIKNGDDPKNYLPKCSAAIPSTHKLEVDGFDTSIMGRIKMGIIKNEPITPVWTFNWKGQYVYDALVKLGCNSTIATAIAKSTTYSDKDASWVYIAGPMRGYEKSNFPAFDSACSTFVKMGYNVISPADIDRNSGYTETIPLEQTIDPKPFVYRDFFALYFIAHQKGGAIVMLPGWENSIGASAEFCLARWLGLKIYAENGSFLRSINYGELSRAISRFLVG